ncbi:hypothetical protein RhiirB3_445483 [Rhizophagus irregularis]|nr:hypothetical protein RhiirB3_445483 [Rhizophagus irregularis]
MNNYQEIKKQRFYDSIFESIIFGNGIKRRIIKRKANEISNFSKLIIWNTVLFSFFPLASASVASFVDTNYEPNTDLYDAILNTFFPIFFVHTLDSISIIFITLFGICLVVSMIAIIMFTAGAFLITSEVSVMYYKITSSLFIICFYAPNILQTLLIALNWPINFYFVKACVFILVLSLTRNVSYYADKVPGDFLATSTTITQCIIRNLTKEKFEDILKGTQISMEEMHEIQKTMQTKIDEMQTTIQTTTDMQKTMQMKIDEIQKTMNENKNINE